MRFAITNCDENKDFLGIGDVISCTQNELRLAIVSTDNLEFGPILYTNLNKNERAASIQA